MRLQERFRVVLFMALVASPLAAQEGTTSGPVPVWKIDGEIRLRGEYRQDFDLAADADDEDAATLSRIRVGIGFLPAKNLSVFVQLQDSRLWGGEASTASNEKNIDLHQGFLRIERLFGESANVSLQAGRFEMAYGDQRLIGNFAWNNVGRAFDGVRVTAPIARAGDLDLFATKLRESPSRAGDREDTDFQGFYFRRPAAASIPAVDLYILRLADDRRAAGERAGQSGPTNVLAYGGILSKRWGRLDAKLEATGQSGKRNGDAHRAWATAAYVAQSFDLGSAPMTVGLGWASASGDGRDDGESRELDNLFPTNHLHYGSMDLFGWRNLRNPYFRASVKLERGILCALDLHRFDLENVRGAWKDAAGNLLGRDPTGRSGRHVGNEIDLIVTVPFREKLKAQIGVARFWPGEFAKRVRGGDPQDWAYVQLSLPF